jgi:hypothetical protein
MLSAIARLQVKIIYLLSELGARRRVRDAAV